MTGRALDPQAQQLARRALAEHNTGTIVRAGRRPTPSWVRPVRLGTNEADRTICRYLLEHPEAYQPWWLRIGRGASIALADTPLPTR